MPIVSAPAENMGGDFIFGLGIKEIDANQRHCGVIYRPDAEVVRFLHLAFHFDLRDEALNGTYWWAPSGLDPENQLVLAALANVIAEGHPSIPYGFDMDGLIFDKATGALLPAPPGEGLPARHLSWQCSKRMASSPFSPEVGKCGTKTSSGRTKS